MDLSTEDYIRGKRAAILKVLNSCLRELGIDDPVTMQSKWIAEREETVAMLRQVCAEHGDNEWPDDLHLADVVDKHLWNHLERLAQKLRARNQP